MTKDLVSVKTVIDGIYRLRGFDPDSYSPSQREKENYADLVTEAVRTAWEDQPWPLLMTCGLRRYRPDWAEGVFWRTGQDCWHVPSNRQIVGSSMDGTTGDDQTIGRSDGGRSDGGRYWHALRDSIGVEPGTNGTVWEEIPPGQIGYKFISFDQPWAGPDGLAMEAIDPTGVELGAFAFRDDPMNRADAAPLAPCRMAAECVFLPDDAPDEVWIRFRPECPVFTLTAYDATRTYHANDTCHVASSGECWRCRALELAGVAPGTDARWERVGVPRFMLQYVRRRLRAELESEDEGKFRSEAMADRELERLRDKWISTANGSAKLRFSNPRRAARP